MPTGVKKGVARGPYKRKNPMLKVGSEGVRTLHLKLKPITVRRLVAIKTDRYISATEAPGTKRIQTYATFSAIVDDAVERYAKGVDPEAVDPESNPEATPDEIATDPDTTDPEVA